MSTNTTTSTTGSRRTLGRAIGAALAVMVGIIGLGTAASPAGALPSSDPYEEIGPTTTVPRAELTVSIRFTGVTHYETGAWLGSKAVLTVTNTGNKSAGAFTVKADAIERDELGYRRGRTLTHNVGGLGAGKSVSIESLYFRRYCTVDMTATVDAGKTVVESNENNNVAYVNLTRCVSY